MQRDAEQPGSAHNAAGACTTDRRCRCRNSGYSSKPAVAAASTSSCSFASPGGAAMNTPQTYRLPADLRLNQWALSGEWTVKAEAAVLNVAGGRIAYRFHARDLHFILGPAARG